MAAPEPKLLDPAIAIAQYWPKSGLHWPLAKNPSFPSSTALLIRPLGGDPVSLRAITQAASGIAINQATSFKVEPNHHASASASANTTTTVSMSTVLLGFTTGQTPIYLLDLSLTLDGRFNDVFSTAARNDVVRMLDKTSLDEWLQVVSECGVTTWIGDRRPGLDLDWNIVLRWFLAMCVARERHVGRIGEPSGRDTTRRRYIYVIPDERQYFLGEEQRSGAEEVGGAAAAVERFQAAVRGYDPLRECMVEIRRRRPGEEMSDFVTDDISVVDLFGGFDICDVGGAGVVVKGLEFSPSTKGKGGKHIITLEY